VPGTKRIPFAGQGEDFDWLTDHALRVAAGNPGNVFGALLALLAGCRSAPGAAAMEKRGATYARVQAVAGAAGLGEEEAEEWERLAESIPLSERQVLHILGALTEDAA
jgi:hypothetical protein